MGDTVRLRPLKRPGPREGLFPRSQQYVETMRYDGVPTAEPVGVAPPDEAKPPTRPRRRRRTTWVGLGMALALVASAVTWIGVRATSKPAVKKSDVGAI